MPARCRTLSLPEPQASAKTAAQPYSNCGVHSVVWIFAIREEALGPHHPHTANGLNDLATLLTNGLCRRDKRRAEPPRLRLSALAAGRRRSLPGSRHLQ